MRIVESEFVKSAVKPDQYPTEGLADIVFAGKSNVGKSSMINTVLNRKLIAKISSKPGKTRLINFFKIRVKFSDSEESGFFNLVDLPGYGYAKVPKSERDSWQKMLDLYFQNRVQIRDVFILVDIRHKADPKDASMIEMLKKLNLPFTVIATKSDKIAKGKIPKALNGLKEGLGLTDETIIPFSSLKKQGVEKVINRIEKQIF
ncbi:MAG: GTP-binding protein [Candidatus Cloacimonadota bacterium]|nr:MAG: GTP-binding protein [Candidatus Cloacimonadota bacterium]